MSECSSCCGSRKEVKGAIGAFVPSRSSRQPMDSMSDRRFTVAVVWQGILAL